MMGRTLTTCVLISLGMGCKARVGGIDAGGAVTTETGTVDAEVHATVDAKLAESTGGPQAIAASQPATATGDGNTADSSSKQNTTTQTATIASASINALPNVFSRSPSAEMNTIKKEAGNRPP